jgi:hypothetical protein
LQRRGTAACQSFFSSVEENKNSKARPLVVGAGGPRSKVQGPNAQTGAVHSKFRPSCHCGAENARLSRRGVPLVVQNAQTLLARGYSSSLPEIEVGAAGGRQDGVLIIPRPVDNSRKIPGPCFCPASCEPNGGGSGRGIGFFSPGPAPIFFSLPRLNSIPIP